MATLGVKSESLAIVRKSTGVYADTKRLVLRGHGPDSLDFFKSLADSEKPGTTLANFLTRGQTRPLS